MSIIEILDTWSAYCAKANIQWHLYRETLLCAAGYLPFPPELDYAQVVISSEDLSPFTNSLIPALSYKWTVDLQRFSSAERILCFRENSKIVLTVDMLTPHQTSYVESNFEQMRSPIVKMLHYHHLFSKLGLSRIANTFCVPKQEQLHRTFSSLITLASTINTDSDYYTDCLTNPNSIVLPKDWFSATETLTCDGHTYPVFSGYREYLSEVYGDYENGLTDDIGVGLTLAEKQELKNHQQHCKQALAFIQELSQEFGLRYHLLAGSVLGPIRHGDFIPWDDDIDIGIRVEELDAFEAIVKEELPKRLPPEFTLKQSGANNPYPRMFSKICYEGRCCMDLWPLVPTYIDGWKAKFTWYFAKIITKVHYYKIGYKVTRFLKIVKPMSLFLTDNWTMKLARWNERRHVGKNAPAYINLYSIYRRGKETIKREWLDTPATADFDGIQVPIVGQTEQYLTHLYGDYMSLPAPWKRASRHFERF